VSLAPGRHEGRARPLGAHEYIDYWTTDVTDWVKDITDDPDSSTVKFFDSGFSWFVLVTGFAYLKGFVKYLEELGWMVEDKPGEDHARGLNGVTLTTVGLAISAVGP